MEGSGRNRTKECVLVGHSSMSRVGPVKLLGNHCGQVSIPQQDYQSMPVCYIPIG